jgi:hypothetical protein
VPLEIRPSVASDVVGSERLAASFRAARSFSDAAEVDVERPPCVSGDSLPNAAVTRAPVISSPTAGRCITEVERRERDIRVQTD